MMKLKWLEDCPKVDAGVSFGLPWPKGKHTELKALEINGKRMQSWPMAYWPDGSIKWSGHAVVMKKNNPKKIDLINCNKDQDKQNETLVISEREHVIKVDVGEIQVWINRFGDSLIRRITNNAGITLAENGKLVAIVQNEYDEAGKKIIEEKKAGCQIHDVVIERQGDIKATVKLTGTCGEDGELRFSVRLTFYYGLARIKMVHTLFNNEESQQNRIKGFGLQMSGVFTGDPYNRQIRVPTESGVYNEPAKLLLSRRYRSSDLYQAQIQGDQLDLSSATFDILEQASGNAVWQDFKLTQITDGTYYLKKRTDRDCSWVKMLTGKQSSGLLYAGGEKGGIAVALKDFYQKFPSQLSVTDLAEEHTALTIWFWSPDAEPMDLRHYSHSTHVHSAYEGFEDLRATPQGIANTSEAYISFYSCPPTNEELFNLATYCQKPSLLIAEPEYYHQTKALGTWSLPDNTSPMKAFIEKQLNHLIDFYLNEIKQRKWFGYWDYGDIMHSYDPHRHQWYYDMGGYAWQNTELVPNLWLWYSFFRTGNAEIYRWIEAMTRHNSEVDRYHFGPYKGLGSRHNVSHWGCGCKEARISMACLYKYYYYLTTDERMEELLDEVKDADLTLDSLDPMREFYGDDQFKTHARVGPDWAAFCSNWMSTWERKKDDRYLKKILTGLDCIEKSPHRLLSGPTYAYNTTTSELTYMGTGNHGGYHMVIAFGAPQVWLELASLIEHDTFDDMIAEFGRVYAMNDDEKRRYSGGQFSENHFHWPMFASGLIGYAANRDNRPDLAAKAWDLLLKEELSGVPLPIEEKEINGWAKLKEIDWITTNVVSQWSLNMLMCLTYIKDYLPDDYWGLEDS